MSLRARITLAGMLALSACGTLPHPFEGHPGAAGRRLAVPPPARLAVPTPTAALLGPPGAALLAHDLSAALLAQEVPAMAVPAKRGDWQLRIATERSRGMVTPRYSVLSPSGEIRGTVEGLPLSAAAWQAGDAATLDRAANDAGPKLASLLTGIEAAQMQSDPHSLMNRPAKIYFSGVSGAPGDGNISLARQMAVSLPDGGDVIQNTRHGADFTLHGKVTLTHLDRRTDHVEIVWTVDRASGAEAGKVAQLNDIPAHTLDTYWGDVAIVVAHEAAGGIRQVITNNSGRANKPPATPVSVTATPRIARKTR
ncbi:hypothetical protein [Lichenicoccus sp.]|uniref:hypothetical protein n=1 Tax=Lichenicoccus sp. TaxID=2781899 RepID=UPI003D144264